MTIMMKRFLVLSIFSLMTFGAFSQVKEDSPIFNSMLKEMTEKLQLSPEQLSKFKPVYAAYLSKVYQVSRPERGKREMDRDEVYQRTINHIDRKIKVLESQKEVVTNLKDILSPEQLQRLLPVDSKLQAQIRGARKGMRFGQSRNEQ